MVSTLVNTVSNFETMSYSTYFNVYFIIVIVDASDACSFAVFNLRGTGTRNWDVRVTQYDNSGRLGGNANVNGLD